jgi:hypothetical protein
MAEYLTGTNPRISGRRGETVSLNVDFYKNGVLTDPFAVRYVEIYRTSVSPANKVAVVPITLPTNLMYPAPLVRGTAPPTQTQCGTDPAAIEQVGRFILPFSIPADFAVPDVYFDVWYYFADDPCGALGTAGTECDIDDPAYSDLLLKCCHRFWVYPENWFCSDDLQTIRFGFEPLDQRFYSPERRPLEVGLMPLPLYDYNFNLVNPMMPYLRPTIRIETQHNELLVNDAECTIGLRQGNYRSNPYVIQYDLDTSNFLRGTYQYQIKLTLPNGSTRVSRKFIFTIA